MRTLRRLIYGEVVSAVSFVVVGFLALFFFFDLIEEIQVMARYAATGYGVVPALTYIALLIPGHLYELLPIAVLIGTIFVMARLAQNSEFTCLRTSGLSPWLALKTLSLLGLGFVVLTFVMGDYLSPLADRHAQVLKARYQGDITLGQTGAWLREKQAQARYSVNVGALQAGGGMQGVRIFEFDEQGFLRSVTQAHTARLSGDGAWQLGGVDRTEFPARSAAAAEVKRTHLESYRWPSEITSEMVSAALLKPDNMSTLALFQYIGHLDANAQNAQRYEIEFWRKVFYPLSCLVMVVLALPFAYLHFRSSGITTYVFGGVLAGISFFLLNNVFGYMGNLQNWQPWLTAALPGMIYSLLSLAAFGWLVWRR